VGQPSFQKLNIALHSCTSPESDCQYEYVNLSVNNFKGNVAPQPLNTPIESVLVAGLSFVLLGPFHCA